MEKKKKKKKKKKETCAPYVFRHHNSFLILGLWNMMLDLEQGKIGKINDCIV